MTRGEAYEFLLNHCRKEASRYSDIYKQALLDYGTTPIQALDKNYVDEMRIKKNKWDSCVSLMETEENFHMNLFGRKSSISES